MEIKNRYKILQSILEEIKYVTLLNEKLNKTLQEFAKKMVSKADGKSNRKNKYVDKETQKN